MNILPAQEIKKRGVKAIELALKNGPVHIIKNNSPTCVVVTEAQYALLETVTQHKKTRKGNLLQWLLHKKSSGDKSREELDTYLTADRNEWDR